MSTLVEFLLKGRGKLGGRRLKRKQKAGSWHEEPPYLGATLLHTAWSEFWRSQLSFLGAGAGIKLSQLQILLISLLPGKSENNLISWTSIPHWILG